MFKKSDRSYSGLDYHFEKFMRRRMVYNFKAVTVLREDSAGIFSISRKFDQDFNLIGNSL